MAEGASFTRVADLSHAAKGTDSAVRLGFRWDSGSEEPTTAYATRQQLGFISEYIRPGAVTTRYSPLGWLCSIVNIGN
jgi:hypothetical protein